MARYVIVHGAWHTGAEFEATAAPMRAAGHDVHLPTLAGNRAGRAPRTSGSKPPSPRSSTISMPRRSTTSCWSATAMAA
jgi:hypothetical protein